VLEARRLYRFFHRGETEVVALDDVSLSVAPRELVAILGPSGSGKSTLVACLGGLDDPDGGTVTVGGERLSRQPERSRADIRARHIGVLFQADNLFEHLTVSENLRLATALARSRRRGSLDALERLGIAHRRDARPSELSGGELIRAGLAAATVNHPPVLLADEPTGEVDSATEQDVIALLREHAAGGAAVVVVTHSAAVGRAADRVVEMRDGRVVP
jgi:putative ABC transport system ATP-binding protein